MHPLLEQTCSRFSQVQKWESSFFLSCNTLGWCHNITIPEISLGLKFLRLGLDRSWRFTANVPWLLGPSQGEVPGAVCSLAPCLPLMLLERKPSISHFSWDSTAPASHKLMEVFNIEIKCDLWSFNYVNLWERILKFQNPLIPLESGAWYKKKPQLPLEQLLWGPNSVTICSVHIYYFS